MNRLCLITASLLTLALNPVRPAVATDPVLLNFNLPSVNSSSVNSSSVNSPISNQNGADSRQLTSSADVDGIANAVPVGSRDRQRQLFAGGVNSLVARTLGHAEGTRTEQGDKTAAYYGHIDPGNGVWNLGTFSFQHCPEAAYQCTTPEAADIYQLRRLQGQALALQESAEQMGLRLTLLEHLNGIDLANQAPLAALGTPGYVALLRQAQHQGLTATEALLWARVQSYWNPKTQAWDAPGLGNTMGTIRADQNRRMAAIALALTHYPARRSAP
jgi:hypothetical protein